MIDCYWDLLISIFKFNFFVITAVVKNKVWCQACQACQDALNSASVKGGEDEEEFHTHFNLLRLKALCFEPSLPGVWSSRSPGELFSDVELCAADPLYWCLVSAFFKSTVNSFLLLMLRDRLVSLHRLTKSCTSALQDVLALLLMNPTNVVWS